MSRSAPDPRAADPLWPGPAGFAHRGLHGPGFPENSLIAFAAALERGAGIECDLRLTADNRIVVFHDADAMRMCASPLVIGRANAAEIARLRLADGPVPTLASLLELVDGRVPLLLEVKVTDDLWRWTRALSDALSAYSGPYGIMSFHPGLIRKVKTQAPHVRRGLVIAADLPPFRRLVSLMLADPDFIAVDRAALGQPWVARWRQRVPVYSWTIRTAEERAQATVQADALIWEHDGRP